MFDNSQMKRIYWTVLIAIAAACIALASPWLLKERLPSLQAKMGRQIAMVPNPQVVILGSSRAAFGVVSTVLEKSLGLPPASVLNAGFPGMYAPDIAAGWALYRKQLDQAKLVIYMTDDYYLATPTEHKGETVLRQIEFVRRLNNVPENIKEMLAGGGDTDYWFDENRLLRHSMVDATDRMTNTKDRSDVIHGLTKAWYDGFNPNPQMEERIIEFLSGLKREGKRVVLLHAPVHSEYRKYVLDKEQRKFAFYERGLKEIASRAGVELIYLDRPEDAGLTDADFIPDPVHFRRDSAAKFTRELGNKLKKIGRGP